MRVNVAALSLFFPNLAFLRALGFSRVYGYPVGIIANNGVLFSESALKVSRHWRQNRDPVPQLSCALLLIFVTLKIRCL